MYQHWQVDHPCFLPPELTLYICVGTKNVSAVEFGIFTCKKMREIIISTFFFFVLIHKKRTTHNTHLCLNARVMAQYDSVVSRQRHT